VSLQTIVSGGVIGRSRPRRSAVTPTAISQPHSSEIMTLLSGASMRVLETGIAVVALATAVLIGLGR